MVALVDGVEPSTSARNDARAQLTVSASVFGTLPQRFQCLCIRAAACFAGPLVIVEPVRRS